MIFKYSTWRILMRVLLLLLTLTLAAFFLERAKFIYFCFTVPVIIYQVIEFFRFHKKAHDELSQFVESVHYRDFSRNFDVKHAPSDLKSMRKGFNEINSTFKIISKEKETQYLYLQKILELVDTGILSYREDNGDILWMNDSLKRMLAVPYLKSISSLGRRDEELYKQVISLKPGESRIATAHLESSSFRLVLSATAFQTDGEKFKLIAFQNVSEALDETEAKAWQKLLSVMTHEIMNSVAPISSLADTLKNRMMESKNETQHTGTMDDLEIGIETIKRRSEGLLKFAETYRNLNKITKPDLQNIFVRDLFENIHRLMQPTLEQKNIELEIVLSNTSLQLEADINLIEQILINLVVNAIEALKNIPDAKIIMNAFQGKSGKAVIKVADNGNGMPEEILEKIFIPFFTTKKNGSGIGLSFSKQIMMLHKGNIQVQSVEGKGSVFILQF